MLDERGYGFGLTTPEATGFRLLGKGLVVCVGGRHARM